MTNEEILEKQVEALEKLLQIKEAIIKEQESMIGRLEMERLYNPPHFVTVSSSGTLTLDCNNQNIKK